LYVFHAVFCFTIHWTVRYSQFRRKRREKSQRELKDRYLQVLLRQTLLVTITDFLDCESQSEADTHSSWYIEENGSSKHHHQEHQIE
jgi:hypothetical protein